MGKNILAIVDAPDPDNIVMIRALQYLHPEVDTHLCIALTGRPVALHDNALAWEYDMEASRAAQHISAYRFRHALPAPLHLYDGGIAPQTLVPHHLHFKDYYQFGDNDPLIAQHAHGLKSQTDLIREILKKNNWIVVVGGPMTALYQILVRCPEIAIRIGAVHAMFGSWGTVNLMDLGDDTRGARQFNVACDPQAAHAILMGLNCPITLLPTEVTRVKEIGFHSFSAFASFLNGCSMVGDILHLYQVWYENVVAPRQKKNPEEMIFIHDLAPALSTVPDLQAAIYDVRPVEFVRVPHLSNESFEWGLVEMKQISSGHNYAAIGLKSCGTYLKILGKLFE